ncbi:ESX-1 secretion-associated protein [Amycolatopsis sp. WAC 01376]|uniref:WXG100 family type VII secretion target n=1 Tax=Amycolatopsis sp. WAC 01376 TaxID=2203195 RepID=UPI000F77481A|nr:type VII secretion target [Amycolatopsis sp. WAC 01376]RSM55188.1 ESX-1 secretion-associated protein [Amycolatopsis sp. WAC 01376]
MTAEPSYTVDSDQLRRHAGRLAAHADQLSSFGTSLPGELTATALGPFAQCITAGIGAAMNRTRDAFAHTASTMDKVGDGLRRAADLYQRTDEDHAARLNTGGTFGGGTR